MKKNVVMILVSALLFTALACSSKPITDADGANVIGKVIAAGAQKDVNCIDALTNEDITKEVLKSFSISTASYAKWLESEAGQQALQDALVKCMSE